MIPDYALNAKITNFANTPVPQVNAAHQRTDIEIPGNIDSSDNDIMDDENLKDLISVKVTEIC